MKNYNLNSFKVLKIGFMFTLVLLISACEKQWIDPDINNDPDSPSDVPMSLMLPAIEQAMGYNLLGNNSVRTNNIWMQLFDGVERQSFTEARYQLTPADVNNLWSSIYTEMMQNLVIFIDKAENTEGKESPYNAGVGKVLTTVTLGITTDLFGDLPYSDAFKGTENVLQPEFDTQEEIYNSIFALLDAAIADFSKAASENLVDVKGDVIFDNDIDAWLKAAYALKARHKLQLSKINGNAAYTDALTAVNNAFASIGDDMEVPFSNKNKNPIFQFMEERTDIRMCATLVDMLAATSDPRLQFYAALDGNDEYTGSDPGSENADASYPGTYNASDNSPTILMSYMEIKFIQAEANFGLGNPTEALAAYKEAVAASVLKVTGLANTTWLDANINTETEGSLILETIMKQKYIALYSQNQPYNDWRRTGFPTLTLAAGAKLNEIPRRFPYGQSEIDYNLNTPSVVITDRVWWD